MSSHLPLDTPGVNSGGESYVICGLILLLILFLCLEGVSLRVFPVHTHDGSLD